MVKKYDGRAQKGTGDQARKDFEQKLDQVTRTMAKLQVAGARSADTWISPNNNLYVLMVVDANGVKSALGSMQALDEQMRQNIGQHEQDLFREMNQGQ